MAIPNKYKDTLDDLIDRSDTESPDRSDLINKRSRNASQSRGGSPTLSKEHHLDEEVLVTSLEPAPKIQASQVYQRHDVAFLGLKSERAQYGNGQRGGEDGKDKRGEENEKGERSGGGHRKNKVDPVVEESYGSEVSDYYHIIYQC